MTTENNQMENDILGFDPSQLSVFNTNDASKHNENSLIYHTRPVEAKSEDGVYRSSIRVIYNPHDRVHSILEQQSYAMEDNDGFFSVISSLTNGDTNCPIFKAWKKCHYAKKEENFNLWKQSAKVEDGGVDIFDKRYARYVTIQVMKDINHPELEGRFMFWKMPKAIWQVIDKMSNPSPESGLAPIPIMDFLFGKTIKLEVTPGPGKPGDTTYTRQTSYSCTIAKKTSPVTNPDGSSLLNDSEVAVLNKYVEQMSVIWDDEDGEYDADARKAILAKISADANTVEFRKIYSRVMNDLKTLVPDINDELGYKPWAEDVTKRVQAWIDVVLQGKNPKTTDDAAKSAAPTAPEAGMPAAFASAPMSEATALPDDDLPF